MPSRNNIEIEIRAKDSASGVVQQFSDRLDKFGGGAQRVGGAITALDCPVSTAYYTSVAHDESAVLVAAEQVLLRFPFYGYRKFSQELVRHGYQVGERVARRLLHRLGISRAVGKVRVQTTNSNHPHRRYPNRLKGMNLSAPDQVWVADITYIRLGTRFIYLAVILDA